jgi:hypothetical protein
MKKTVSPKRGFKERGGADGKGETWSRRLTRSNGSVKEECIHRTEVVLTASVSLKYTKFCTLNAIRNFVEAEAAQVMREVEKSIGEGGHVGRELTIEM